MNAPKLVAENKNATTAGGSTLVGVFLAWLAGHVHLDLSAEAAVLIAGALTTALLFFWDKGIRGTWRRVMDGKQD